MKEFIDQISEQIKESIKIAGNKVYRKYQHSISPDDIPMSRILRGEVITNVLVCGVGGSGIAGTIVANLFKDDLTLPVLVNKSYNIPNWVNNTTLVIISSYSGTTEETISCFHEALQVTKKIICISTGGTIVEIAKENNIDYVLIPGGYHPRAALIYSLIQLIDILGKQGIIRDRTSEIKDSITFIDEEKDNITKAAHIYTSFMSDASGIHIYSDDINEGIATRFKQQLNENSKVECYVSILPEMNHNEIVALGASNGSNIKHIMLNTGFKSIDMVRRFEFVSKTLTNAEIENYEIKIHGNNSIQKMMYAIHLTDLISYNLSEINNVDPFDVNIITDLKNFIKL